MPPWAAFHFGQPRAHFFAENANAIPEVKQCEKDIGHSIIRLPMFFRIDGGSKGA